MTQEGIGAMVGRLPKELQQLMSQQLKEKEQGHMDTARPVASSSQPSVDVGILATPVELGATAQERKYLLELDDVQLLVDGDRPLALLLDDVGVSSAISECMPRPLSLHMAALDGDMQQRCVVDPMPMFLCLQRPDTL